MADLPPNFATVAVSPSDRLLTASQAQSGPWIDPTSRVVTYSPDEWETFIDEWVSSLVGSYLEVLRFTGAGDMGIDIAGFVDAKFLTGIWDCFQCKHYTKALGPAVAWPEIGKILWYSFNKNYVPPRAYYFVAPRGTSTSLTRLLANSPKLKAHLLAAWNSSVRDHISSAPVALEGAFAAYVESFDFSIFKPISLRKVIEEHRQTVYFIPRFGGGLPARPKVEEPPSAVAPFESKYVTRLLEAYADHTKSPVPDVDALKGHATLADHFRRSREAFYHAESLRIFVRDKVEPGTFESLQNEIFDGVIDTQNEAHPDGFACVVEVTKVAQAMALDAHPLSPSTMPTDRRGICHQLANEDRLRWTK